MTMAGMSQREMTACVGISQSKVSRVINGQATLSIEEVTTWVRAAGATDRLERFLELNEAAHGAKPELLPNGTVRVITLVQDNDAKKSHIQIQTPYADIVVTDPSLVTRYGDLFDQITGAAVSHSSAFITLRQDHA